jgi:hypothetical protein
MRSEEREKKGKKREGRTAVTARENWDMGWRVEGQESIKSSTNLGMEAREAQSAERAVHCSWVGTSPVRRSQKRASGRGSDPPGALGRSSWHSGMVLPRNRIPSSAEEKEARRQSAAIALLESGEMRRLTSVEDGSWRRVEEIQISLKIR